MGEITVILLLALIFLGPKKLPEMASGLGRMIRQFRKITADVKNEIVLDDAIRKPFEELRDAVTLHPEELKRRDNIKQAIEEARQRLEAEVAASNTAPANPDENGDAAPDPAAMAEGAPDPRFPPPPIPPPRMVTPPLGVPAIPPPPPSFRPAAPPAGTVARRPTPPPMPPQAPRFGGNARDASDLQPGRRPRQHHAGAVRGGPAASQQDRAAGASTAASRCRPAAPTRTQEELGLSVD